MGLGFGSVWFGLWAKGVYSFWGRFFAFSSRLQLATWQHGNLATWQLGNLAASMLSPLKSTTATKPDSWPNRHGGVPSLQSGSSVPEQLTSCSTFDDDAPSGPRLSLLIVDFHQLLFIVVLAIFVA